MGALNAIRRVFGWILTIILQIAVSFLIIYIFSVIFPGAESETRLGWLALLFVLWFSYVVGINLVGQLAFRRVWKDVKHLQRPRVVGTMIGAAIPLLILLIIGYSLPFGGADTPFDALVIDKWQPTLAQASLSAALVGFYVPSIRSIQELLGIANQA